MIGHVVYMDFPVVVAIDFVVVSKYFREVKDGDFATRSVMNCEYLNDGVVCGTRRREAAKEGLLVVDCLTNGIELLALLGFPNVACTYYDSPLHAISTVSTCLTLQPP